MVPELKSFLELKKSGKQKTDGLPNYKLAVLGDCATQHLSTALKGYAADENLNLEVYDADYNQINAQVFDPGSELYNFNPNGILLATCVQMLYSEFCQTESADRINFANVQFDRLKQIWSGITERGKYNIFQFTYPEADDRVWGNYANKNKDSFLYQLRKLNFMMSEYVAEQNNLFLIDQTYILTQLGVDIYWDQRLYDAAKIAFSLNSLPYIAKEIIDVIKATLGIIKKCVILDLDNTLWGGVIGDDGLAGIEIGDLGRGHAFSEFQMWLKQLKERGIILAVCSKNNEDIAKEPFEKLSEMVLKLSDIAVFVANWNDKASNIRDIRQILNIGMDSIVFLDDNPFERNAVRTQIADITVPDLPQDPELYVPYLQSLNLFETASYSKNDADRTGQYQAEIKRRNMQARFTDYSDYLKSLNMRAVCKPFDEISLPRIAQLTQRSNQFNLRTVRYQENELSEMMNNDEYITLYFTLKDDISDHGLISVVILKVIDKDTLFIDTWLMSCRVLKRGVEEFIINKITDVAKEAGYSKVIGEYIKTKKNSMVEHIYSDLGFEQTDDNLYLNIVNEFKPLDTYIGED